MQGLEYRISLDHLLWRHLKSPNDLKAKAKQVEMNMFGFSTSKSVKSQRCLKRRQHSVEDILITKI